MGAEVGRAQTPDSTAWAQPQQPDSWRKPLEPEHAMTRWALPVLLVLMLGRVLAAPVTPLPAFQLLPQNRPQTTPSPVAWESPPATTTGPPAAWGYRSPSARHGPRITLSLDVPIGLLQVLLEQARTRAASQRAATNARVLAQVGRR